MQVRVLIPYSLDKNLGKAYNESMRLIPDGDAACFIDYDVQFLTPDAIRIIHNYYSENPDSLLTCLTNRVSQYSFKQLLGGKISEDADIRNHIALAESQKSKLYRTTRILRDISGMLMVVPKSLWLQHPIPENGQCLGVDTMYGRQLLAAGKKILRMDGLYVFHAYRLMNGVKNKNHLLV